MRPRLRPPRADPRPRDEHHVCVIESLERAQLRRVPAFQAGDRVRVHFQVIEGTRRRTQVFEGVVIKRQGHGVRETFTVRKQSFGVGVERTFPVHSPKIEKIEVAARGDVRRAKLYYLRDRVGKRARVRERRYVGPEETVEPGLLRRDRGRRRQRRHRRGVVDAEGAADATATPPMARTRRRRPPRRPSRRAGRDRPRPRREAAPRPSAEAERPRRPRAPSAAEQAEAPAETPRRHEPTERRGRGSG